MTALACAGDTVVVGFYYGRLQLREAARLDHVVWSSQVHKLWINDVCVSPSGAEIATACGDNTSAVVSFATGEVFRALKGHIDWVRSVLFTPDGSKVITGSFDKTVRVWPIRPVAEARLASLLHNIDPAKQLYEGEEVAQLFGKRMKRIMFAEVERGDIQG